jgi:hypothetical protein
MERAAEGRKSLMFCMDRATFYPPVPVALLPMRSFTLSLPALLAAPPAPEFSKVRLDSLSDGISPLIAAVGLRLVLITPHLNRAGICVIGRCR